MTAFSMHFLAPHKTLTRALVFGLVFLAPVGGYAQTGDLQALLDRMDRLERDIRTLNQQRTQMPVGGSVVKAPIAEPPNPTTPGASKVVFTKGEKVVFTKGENALSRVLVRMGALEQDVRTATGQAESMTNSVHQLNVRVDKLVMDMDFRLSRLEGIMPGSSRTPGAAGNMNAAPTVSAAPSPPGVSKMGNMPPVGERGTVLKNGLYQPGAQEGKTLGTVPKTAFDKVVAEDPSRPGVEEGSGRPADGRVPAQVQTALAPQKTPQQPTEPAPAAVSSVLPAGTVKEQYKFAINLIRQARNADAEIAFKAFIQAHGEDQLAGNARYWLGETFYVRKNFMQAAQAFFEAYKKFPTGVKAPDSLLKLGMSMANMEKKSEACTTYGKLRREFSGTMRSSIQQALDRETQRLTCK